MFCRFAGIHWTNLSRAGTRYRGPVGFGSSLFATQRDVWYGRATTDRTLYPLLVNYGIPGFR